MQIVLEKNWSHVPTKVCGNNLLWTALKFVQVFSFCYTVEVYFQRLKNTMKATVLMKLVQWNSTENPVNLCLATLTTSFRPRGVAYCKVGLD